MKKLYRKSVVHPTPSAVYDHLLKFLLAAMLALAAGLSPADRQVLAYLISCPSANPSSGPRRPDHPSSFNCNCFRCNMSYWVKWDSSPDSLLIHEIIDAFEENLSKKNKGKKERRRSKSVNELGIVFVPLDAENSDEVLNVVAVEANAETSGGETAAVPVDEEEEEEMHKGSVRKFVSFLGSRIWGGVWVEDGSLDLAIYSFL